MSQKVRSLLGFSQTSTAILYLYLYYTSHAGIVQVLTMKGRLHNNLTTPVYNIDICTPQVVFFSSDVTEQELGMLFMLCTCSCRLFNMWSHEGIPVILIILTPLSLDFEQLKLLF